MKRIKKLFRAGDRCGHRVERSALGKVEAQGDEECRRAARDNEQDSRPDQGLIWFRCLNAATAAELNAR